MFKTAAAVNDHLAVFVALGAVFILVGRKYPFFLTVVAVAIAKFFCVDCYCAILIVIDLKQTCWHLLM